MKLCATALALCLAGVFATRARAGEHQRPEFTVTDTWSEPNPGVRYLHRKTSVPSIIHALVVDLTRPGVRVITTPYDQRWQTVTEFADRNSLAAAMNGGFWGMMQRAEGVTAGGGHRWPDGNDDEKVGFFAVTSDRRAWISPPEAVQDNVSEGLVAQAVSGEPMLVREGKLDTHSLDEFSSSNLRHPRSAAGVSRDGKTVYLIVTDGRQSHSRGMTLYELGRMFVELGAYAAINLDGGGSSAMYLAGERGVINSPSGGRWEARLGFGAETTTASKSKAKVRLRDDGVEEVFVRGVEREVMNHIGVVAPPPGTVAKDRDAGSAATHDEPVVVERPRPPPVRLGRSRELLYPVAYGVVALLVPSCIGVVLWWRKRKPRQRR